MAGLIIDPSSKDNGNGSQQPAWLQTILKVGVPSAIALFLVYTLATNNSTALANVERSQQQHAVDVTRHTELLREVKDSSLRMEIYLRMMCIRLSKTADDRNTCLSIR